MIVRRNIAQAMLVFFIIPFVINAQIENGNIGLDRYSGPAALKITTQPFLNAVAMKTIYWGGQSSSDIYCIGSDNRLDRLRFICRDCNATLGVNTLLSDNTENQSNQAGYPLIKLSAINRRDLNDKTLYCEAQVKRSDLGTGNIGVDGPTIAAQAQMHVSYMDRPIILDASSRRPPVSAPDTGNRFLVACNRQSNGQCSASSGKQLYCEIKANPQPTEIQWTGAGGQVIATGATYTVQPTAISDSVQCRALRPGSQNNQDYSMSDAVKVIPYDRPMTKPDNFQTVISSPPFEGNGQIVRGSGKTFRLTCAAQATPKPKMFWRKRMPSGTQLVANATCENGVHGVTIGEITPQQNMINGQAAQWVIQSECTVIVDTYAKAGDYFCVACVEVGQNEWDCGEDQSLNSPGANQMAIVDVVGPPEFYKQQPQILATEQGGTRITVDYCSDPAPLPNDNGVEWLVDDITIRPGNSYQQYTASMPQRNMTSNYTDCYTLSLNIVPITDYDKSRNYRVRVTNTYSMVEQPFNLNDLLAGNTLGRAGLNGWWIAFIVLMCIAFLMCVITVAFCFMRQMFCFAPNTQKKRDTTRYINNVNASHLPTEPASAQRYKTSFNGAPESGVTYVPPTVQHETVNYAEMDLVSHAHISRPIISHSQPV